MIQRFTEMLSPSEKSRLDQLTSPIKIQEFLDHTPYAATQRNRCPLNVLRDGFAHCLDGGLFAAMALRHLGYPPIIIDLLPEFGKDDDHVLAIFQRNSGYGAIAKSNFSGLRFRDPIYRSLRELVMSYFDDFFNQDAQKTLRAYTRPLNLNHYDRYFWMWDDRGADKIEQRLWNLKKIPLLTDAMIQELSTVDPRAYQAGMLGTDPHGLYQLEKKS